MDERTHITITTGHSSRVLPLRAVRRLVMAATVLLALGLTVAFHGIMAAAPHIETALAEIKHQAFVLSARFSNQASASVPAEQSYRLPEKPIVIVEPTPRPIAEVFDEISDHLGLDATALLYSDDGTAVLNEALFRKSLLTTLPLGYPIQDFRPSDGFGRRFHPIRKVRAMHRGVDFKAEKGTPIFAPADGIVATAERVGTFGKLLVIEHGLGFETKYAHLSTFEVQAGDVVTRGQIIARVGSTGASVGNHLHYEVHFSNTAIDPKHFLEWTPGGYEQLMAEVAEVPWDSLRKIHRLKPTLTAKH